MDDLLSTARSLREVVEAEADATDREEMRIIREQMAELAPAPLD